MSEILTYPRQLERDAQLRRRPDDLARLRLLDLALKPWLQNQRVRKVRGRKRVRK